MSIFQNKVIEKLRYLLNQLAYLPQTLRLIWSAAQVWTIAWVVLLVAQGLLPAATVYLARVLVNALVSVMGIGIAWISIQSILIPASLIVGVMLLTEVLKSLSEWIRTAQSELVQDYITELIHRQSTEIDFGCYELSEYNDMLSQARDGAGGRPLMLLENFGSVLQSSITLFAMAAILLPYGVWLPMILVASTLPAFYVALRVNLRQYRWSQRTTTDRRRLQYYDFVLTNSVHAADVRLFHLGAHMRLLYQRLRQRLRHEQMALIKDQSLNRLLAGLAALVVTGVALAWMGRQVLLGALTLGDLALFYQAFNQGQGIIKALMASLEQIYRNSLFLGNLFQFLQLQPQVIDPISPELLPSQIQKGFALRQVTFRYPGSQDAILENFNLTIPAGKIVAIVGDNGAGKSTLIKLLCRFYDPTSGQIELDGINIRNFSVQVYRRLITVLFQNPMPFYLTAAENITLGDLSLTPKLDEIETAAKGSAIHTKITQLSHKYDSVLGKLFPGGTDLSGGEWQRLALARAFYRKAELIILDEPTSAMDPWAEFDWLERFRAMAEGRTAIVITHRFTLAMRADIIHVMRAGQIVESGSHDQLLLKNGLYAQSWRSQMQASHSPLESQIL